MRTIAALSPSFFAGLLVRFITSAFKATPQRYQIADGQIPQKSTMKVLWSNILQSDILWLQYQAEGRMKIAENIEAALDYESQKFPHKIIKL